MITHSLVFEIECFLASKTQTIDDAKDLLRQVLDELDDEDRAAISEADAESTALEMDLERMREVREEQKKGGE